jgi:basic membrane protein A
MKIMRRVLGGGAAGALVLAVSACGSAASTSSESASPPGDAGSAAASSAAASPAPAGSAEAASDGLICEGQTVTLVSTQKAGDQSVVDDMINNGLNAAETELGATIKYVEALDPSTYESTLANAANAGSGIIATTFLEMGKPLQAAAAQFPDTKFIQIYGDPVEPAVDNLRTVSYRYDEATYLSGLVAGAATETNKLGYEGGMFIPGINSNFNAFKGAASSVNPDVEVVPGEVGSFSDDAKAKEVVSALYAQGVDIVQGDGPVIGLIEAAKDKGKYAIIGAPGLVDKAPANVMGVTYIYFGKSLFDQIAAACAADFAGGHVASGVADGVTGFYVPDQFIAEGDPAMVQRVQDALPAVAEAEAAIKSGDLVVPVDNAGP